MADRGLRRLIEDAWSRETRSPSQMMQELSNRIREAGLHIFRHRRGMLFVSAVRIRPFAHEQGASAQVQAILHAITENPGMHRKDLADKVLADIPAEEAESRKLALASDLHWLISEGNVIEFNDGSLDLPRSKPKPAEKTPEPATAVISEVTSKPAPAESGASSESVSKETSVDQSAEPAQNTVAQGPRVAEEPVRPNETGSSDGAGESAELPQVQEISQSER
jgi:hypothetical protein